MAYKNALSRLTSTIDKFSKEAHQATSNKILNSLFKRTSLLGLTLDNFSRDVLKIEPAPAAGREMKTHAAPEKKSLFNRLMKKMNYFLTLFYSMHYFIFKIF